MAVAILQFVGLAAVIVAAGTVLTHCADAIAEITGWGRLLVGSLLLAGATSLPELSVDISAVRMNVPDLAVGDLFGSSLMNLLILAAMDLSHRSRGKMLSRTAAAHALSGTLGIALTATAGVGILAAAHTPTWTLFNIHASVWVVTLGYLLGVRTVFLDQRIAAKEAVEQKTSEESKPQGKLSRYAAGFVIAAAVILLVGPYLAEAADQIAKLSGLGESFVGTTFVALSTSLPELVASITAMRLGAIDLVIGNVFGSNAFNMLLFFPLDAIYPGTLFTAVRPSHLVSVLAVCVATSVAIMGQLYHKNERLRFIEPDAWLIITLIGGSLFLVYKLA